MNPTQPDITTMATWTGAFGAMLLTVLLWIAYGFGAALIGFLIVGCTVLWTVGLVAREQRDRDSNSA